MKRALIAMSGGVDSSVAAYLAQRERYECIGCTMKLYTNTDAGISEKHTCCSLDDVEDARAVAYRLGMRYCVFNFSEGFRERVMLPFAADYRRARIVFDAPQRAVTPGQAAVFYDGDAVLGGGTIE